MMEALQHKAKELLAAGTVKVVIGYAAGSAPQRARAIFVRKPDEAEQLVWDEHCRQNLAAYLNKPEVKALGKPALVARIATLRTLLQYAVENQLADEAVLALVVTDGQVVALPTFAAIEEYLAQQPRGLTSEQQAELTRLEALSLEERWAFWSAELQRCVKCYACRAACPLCYCDRCIVEVNQPQWIPVASDMLGNLEWNVVRAMHLAGRCVDCGSCADACPENIRLDLLNHVAAQEVLTHFGAEPGCSTRKDYALAAYKPDDKEEFIR
jgi:formate dehydrogenase subunit beta